MKRKAAAEGRKLLAAATSGQNREETKLSIHEQLELHDCPYCGGAGLLEEEQGWCWVVTCLDCGAQTAQFEFKNEAEREQAARTAAHLWNIGKVVRGDIGE